MDFLSLTGKMLMFESGNIVLVMSQTLMEADNKKESEFCLDLRATDIYGNIDVKWLCAIDNSYGTSLLE